MNNKATLGILLCCINLAIIEAFNIKLFLPQILSTHIFLFSLSVFSGLCERKALRLKKTTPFYLLSVGFLRIIACVVFLMPIILNYEAADKNYIYNFFIFYFIYLFHEVIFKNKNRHKINR
tara:strand:+ start:276 stop:638 length:363 start_codon:yes stop_codon:yes gene_type:complete